MSDLDRTALTAWIRTQAADLGFGLVGVCPALAPDGFHRFLQWLDLGYAGEMQYLREREAAYAHPEHVLEGVRSIVMLGMDYFTKPRPEGEPGTGLVASYARGEEDYHDLIHRRLKQLKRGLLGQRPSASVRGVVDTAPLLEREFAQLAGLGWVGKNTLLLAPGRGSYFFLAALLTDLELAYDAPFTADHCGSCTACLDACPTQAFPQPYVLDARRCISYLTIEHRTSLPVDMVGQWSDWLFGCDVCQEVCPWNRHAPPTEEAALQPVAAQNPVDLMELFELDDESFRARFRRTPLWRSKRRGILRNAALVLGAQRHRKAVPALERGMLDAEPLVREASQWALAQITGTADDQEGHSGLR